MAKNLLTDNLLEPLNNVTAAKVDIKADYNNLMISHLSSGEQALVKGSLQYFEAQGLPARNLLVEDSKATFTLKGSGAGRPRFRLPWSGCNGATEWQIYLNSAVSFDITAHSEGGNVKLDLSDLVVTRVSADTGGGNMDVFLPDHAVDLSVSAKTGAGNVIIEIGSNIKGSHTIDAASGAGDVTVGIPSGLAAKIHIKTGLGKAIVDSRFSKGVNNTYQSLDFDSAAHKVEITANSGAGNVSIATK